MPPPNQTQEAPEEREARLWGKKIDTWLRIAMVVVIAVLLIGLNYRVMQFIDVVFAADMGLPAANRVITKEVLMSLIGATVVQVGVATIAIVGYLFPKVRLD